MKRVVGTCLAVAFLLTVASFASAQGPWYAMGDYYTPNWTADAGDQLYDDGLHGDGAAGDGLWGGTVVSNDQTGRKEFKIGLADWSQSYPGCNSWVHNPATGTAIHFTFDTRTHTDGWLPTTNIVWSDHYAPAGTQFEVIGSAPETGNWNSGVPAVYVKSLWELQLVIATPGTYEAKFRAVGSWDICNIGSETNTPCGANLSYTTTQANQTVRFLFNPVTGRARVEAPTATPGSSVMVNVLIALLLAGAGFAVLYVSRKRAATA